MIFVDTNYFIRFLLNDVNSQHIEAKSLFERGLKGEIKLFTSLLVLFEVYWVFTSFYEKSKLEVINILRNIIKLSFIELPERELISQALDIFESNNIEFEDSYNIVYAKSLKVKEFATFDVKLQRAFIQTL